MKKVFLFLLPPLIAVIAFLLLVFFLNKESVKGALQVTASLKSKVYLDGKLVGETPFCKCEGEDMLKVGSYTVRLVPKDEGFSPYEEKITIGPSVLTVVDRIFGSSDLGEGKVITLTKLPDKDKLELLVVSLPEGVGIYLDNVEVGKTPYKNTSLTASDHELRLVRDGYREKTIRIRTVLGYRVTIAATLGVFPNLTTATSSAETQIATESALPSVTKIIIVNTPTGFLRVRESGSLSSSEIARVNPGETYDLVEEKEGWFSIKLKDGKVGWVSNQYAKKQ
ncbi:MAG: PEGA domain-containing protein [Candidatus Levyibacteriota bacterium]|nr:MAG: PEGA domain-containing protein [Candidatus Levybacteria bacterium]